MTAADIEALRENRTLDGLRSRSDYQRLLAELEGAAKPQ
jgi:hypothetical protein